VLEATMAGFVVPFIALALGVVVSVVIAGIAVAVRREDRCYTLIGAAPDRLSSGTRRLTGLGSRNHDAKLLVSRPLTRI
jgi:hypothetical protein